jgi:hypothetical protein
MPWDEKITGTIGGWFFKVFFILKYIKIVFVIF